VAEQLSDASPVTGAITRRILKQRLDLLKQYGPELVGAAIDNVADYVGDVDEIGSSDVSAWVAQVERMLRDNPPEAFAEASKTRNPTRDFLRNNPVSSDQMAKPVKQMSVQELATVSDEALDNAYHYGRSTPGNTFGWQANLKSAAYAKQMINKGVTDIEQISDAIHKGWNVTARAFVSNPEQFDDTAKLQVAGKLEAKLQQRAKLMNIEYAQLPDDEQEKDRVVARALLQAIKGQLGVAEGQYEIHHLDPEGRRKAIYHHGKGYTDDVVRKDTQYHQERNPRDTFQVFKDKQPFDWQDMAEGVTEGTNYWTKLQDARNKKINSLVNELKESIM
jgi:hypothetical protein